MKITCPHCQAEFDAQDAIVRPRKDRYRWYDFSGSNTFCPRCDKAYLADITVAGALLFCLLIALAYLAGERWGYLYSSPIWLLLCVLFVYSRGTFIKIRGA